MRAVCFAIEYGNMLMCSLFLCTRCPLLQPIGGPKKRGMPVGRVEEGGGGGVDGRQELRVTGGRLFSSSKKPHKTLDADLRVMSGDVVFAPSPLTTTSSSSSSSFSPCRHPVHPIFFVTPHPLLTPVAPPPPSSRALCPACLLELLSAEREWMPALPQLGEMR